MLPARTYPWSSSLTSLALLVSSAHALAALPIQVPMKKDPMK